MSEKICGKCGAVLHQGDIFCGECGENQITSPRQEVSGTQTAAGKSSKTIWIVIGCSGCLTFLLLALLAIYILVSMGGPPS